LTARGTPTIYQGDELGMADVPIPQNRVQDPWEKNVPGLGLGRDPERTPMQWDAGENAGFTGGEPWLPLSDDYVDVNVKSEGRDSGSMLSLYRALLRLRRTEPALSVGVHVAVEANGDALSFRRQYEDQRVLVALNLGAGEASVAMTEPGRVLLSTHLDRGGE